MDGVNLKKTRAELVQLLSIVDDDNSGTQWFNTNPCVEPAACSPHAIPCAVPTACRLE